MLFKSHTYESVARSLADGLSSGDFVLPVAVKKATQEAVEDTPLGLGFFASGTRRIVHWRAIATAFLSLFAAILILSGLDRASLSGIGSLIAIILSILLNIFDIFDFRPIRLPWEAAVRTMSISQELSGKVALVTGASRGLGAAIATSLGQRGAKVAVNTFGSPEKAKAVADAIVKRGGSAEVFKADVRDEGEVQAMVAAIEGKLGPVDILVCNATGPQPFVKVEDLTWQLCLDQLEFFVKSPILLTQAVLPGMKARRYGRIIQIGSEVFEKGIPQFSNYVSAKGAQLGLTLSWANELAEWQITVNLVAPGWIPTERHAGDSQDMKDAYAKGVPMKHMGEPEDIGEAVAFLASDSARFITGQRLSVNGGNTVG